MMELKAFVKDCICTTIANTAERRLILHCSASVFIVPVKIEIKVRYYYHLPLCMISIDICNCKGETKRVVCSVV